MKFSMICAMTLGVMAALASTADAASVNTQMHPGVNQADDASGEYISLGGATSNNYDPTRTISVGDAVRGAFNISRLNSTPPNVGLGGVNEWSGVFSILVTSITEDDTTPDGDPSEQDWTITFGVDPFFAAWLTTIGGAGAAAGMLPGTMIRMWEDTTPDIDLIASDAGPGGEDADFHVLTAMDGTFYWDMGFGPHGAIWEIENSALVAPAGLSTSLAGSPANFELSLLASGPGAITIVHGALTGQLTGLPVDFNGNSDVLGAGSDTSGTNEENAGFHAKNKAGFQFVVVPTPSAVWAGLALMGLLGINRMRRRQTI